MTVLRCFLSAVVQLARRLPSAWSDPIDDYVRSQLAAPSPTGRREYTNAEFVALLAARPLRFKPGEQWAYTNAFPLRGMVIEPPWAGCFQGT